MCGLIIFITLFLNVIYVGTARINNKEAYLSVPKLISSAGYPTERHRVTTEDGYILQMHRIPAGKRTARRSDDPSAKGKKAVLLMHGLLGSSGDFLIMGPDRSLGYLLADAGYDVWLGNLRGNWYTTHERLNRNQSAFWEYSFHEHGKHDVPAMIDKVLNVTGLERLMYIGYSMGTTSFFTMMSHKPEYNSKIVAFLALAPAVYLDNVKPLASLFLKTVNLPKTMQERGLMSLTMTPRLTDFLLNNICNFKNPRQDMCSALMYFVVGEDREQYDPITQSIIISRMQPASWRQIEHFGKIAITGEFTSWEDGLWGAVKPYKISNVKVPVSLLYGENDRLVEKSQIMRLADDLKKIGMLELLRPGCSWPKFNHLDFVFAKDVGVLLNKPIIKHVHKLYIKYDSN